MLSAGILGEAVLEQKVLPRGLRCVWAVGAHREKSPLEQVVLRHQT